MIAFTKARCLGAAVLGAVLLVAALDAGHGDAAAPPQKCNTSPAHGQHRWSAGNLWNFCVSDTWSGTELMYWNYLPGTPGYNNPGAGPFSSSITSGANSWSAVSTNWRFAYQNGDWNAGTDVFVYQADECTAQQGCQALTRHWWCQNSTTCTYLPYTDTQGGGSWYNLTYIILDDSYTGSVPLAAHEFGHAFGLVHGGPNTQACPGWPLTALRSIMIYACYPTYITAPTARDGVDVDAIYPEGVN